MGHVLPLELILFVTNRCNLKCRHCFINDFGTDSAMADLDLKSIEMLSSDLPNLLVLMLTGGEPFLRDDFSEIIRIFSTNSNIEVISVVTNGFLKDKISQAVECVLSHPKFRSTFIVTISFDGIGKDHDSIRGRKGAYQNALETAGELKKLQKNFPELIVSANITLTDFNEKKILNVARELADTNLFSSLSQNIFREMKPRHAFKKVDLNVYRELTEFTSIYSKGLKIDQSSFFSKWHHLKERYQAMLIEKTCQTNSYQNIPCEAGRGIGVVYQDGSVAPCELLEAGWGNIKEKSFADIWNNKINRKASDELRSSKCFCTHECFQSASLNLQAKSVLNCLNWNLFKDHKK